MANNVIALQPFLTCCSWKKGLCVLKGRGSNCSIPSSLKQGSGILRSFVFERDDSNSKSTISMAENSSEMIPRENRPTKTASAKYSNSQIKSSSQPRKDERETSSGAQLLEILRRFLLQTSYCTRNSIVDHTESIFAAFKLGKKSIVNKENVSIKTLDYSSELNI
ncbi:hypothetical protein PTKIN_Ptkin13bG0003200 [Pterospermum kingtungense]